MLRELDFANLQLKQETIQKQNLQDRNYLNQVALKHCENENTIQSEENLKLIGQVGRWKTAAKIAIPAAVVATLIAVVRK